MTIFASSGRAGSRRTTNTTNTTTSTTSLLGRCSCPSCMGQTTPGAAQGFGMTNLLSLNPSWSGNAVAGNGKVILTSAQAATQLAREGLSWRTSNNAAPTVITYSFYRSNPGTVNFPDEGRGFSIFSAAQANAARQALALWSSVANIRFVEVPNVANANIKFGNTTTGPAQAWAYMPSFSYVQGGSVWINPNQPSNRTLNPGQYGYLTLVHEIGHALGLDHPGDYNYTPGQTFSYATQAEYLQDSWQYTVMSYFSETNTGANFRGAYASTPMLHDIAAIQSIYGVRTDTRLGNTVYGFNSNAGVAAYDFRFNTRPVVTIYDNGGLNSLDCSGFGMGNRIDLNPGTFSSVGGLTNNVAIAENTIIRRAVGGFGADTFIANDYGCTMEGRGGNDRFYSGIGNDVMLGGIGNSIYYFASSFGRDIVQQDLRGTATLTFDSARTQLGFTRSGADLLVNQLTTGDQVRLSNFYGRTSAFRFADGSGSFSLTVTSTGASVAGLVQAPSSNLVTPPVTGGLSKSVPVSVTPVTVSGNRRAQLAGAA